MRQPKLKYSILLLLFCCAAGCNSKKADSLAQVAVPDTSLSVPLGRWPNADDLKKLEQLKGKGSADIIKSIGHPKQLTPKEDGSVTWRYDWQAVCELYVKNDIVVRWYYNAGF